MSDLHRNVIAAEHEAVLLLLPWYVNDTLDDSERARVQLHVAGCMQCRDDLALEQRIHGAMSTDNAVEYMPAASLNRLRERLDGKTDAPGQPCAEAMPRRRRLYQWRSLTAASIAVAIGLLATDRWLQDRGQRAAPLFHTVTQDAPRPPGEVVRAVFSPNITLVELQALLNEAQLRIISGPSEAGVYSLAAKGTLPVDRSLALLRQHAEVRFAEAPAAADSRAP